MLVVFSVFFVKHKPAYEMRISDWSSDVCSSDLILKSTLEIDGRMGRLQAEGQPDYSIVDGEQMATHVVMVEDRMIMTMDPAELAAANGASKTDAEPVDLGAEKIGEREIRGYDTTGYRFKFMDNIATVWLSEDLDEDTGRFFDIWTALNPLGVMMEVGEGAAVRAVMVNPESLSGKASFMPAYTITEDRKSTRLNSSH